MIFIKAHRPRLRSRDYLPGLHIHDRRSRIQGEDNRNLIQGDPDQDHPDAVDRLQSPRGSNYTPDVNRWRELLKEYKHVHPEEAKEAECLHVKSHTIDTATEEMATPNPTTIKSKGFCTWIRNKAACFCVCRCNSKYKVDLELEQESGLVLKVMLFRAFQMLTAFGVTFYTQATWVSDAPIARKPATVRFAFEFSWLLYVGIISYSSVHFLVRFTQVAKWRWSALILYLIKLASVSVSAFIAGVRWELATASMITLTVGAHAMFLGLFPQFNEEIQVSKRPWLMFLMTIVDVTLISIGSFFAVSTLLATYDSIISVSYKHDGIYSNLFLYGGSTWVISGCIALLDLVELQKILSGQRFLLERKGWLRAAASL